MPNVLEQVLPEELICVIVEFCDAEDLPTLCLVTRAVRAWALPLLYHTVDLTAKPQCDSFVLACTSTSGGTHTRRLSLGLLQPADLGALLPCVPHLKHLRACTVALPPPTPPLTHLFLAHRHSAAAWLRAAPLPSVTHVFLEDPYCVGTLGFARVAALFPALTHGAFSTRPIHGGHLASSLRGWLNIPCVRRVVLCVVFSDAQQKDEGWPEMLGEMRKRVRDERAFVSPIDAMAVMPRTATADSVTRRTRMATDALGRDAFRGTFDLWNIGTCLGSPE